MGIGAPHQNVVSGQQAAVLPLRCPCRWGHRRERVRAFSIKNIWLVGRKQDKVKGGKGKRREGKKTDGNIFLLKGREGGREWISGQLVTLQTFIWFCKKMFLCT